MINSRRKGHSFERLIVKDFKEIGYTRAERTQEGSKSDRDGIDIMNAGEWRPQCKVGAKYCQPKIINEVYCRNGIPIVITKADRQGTLAILKWKDMITIMKRLMEHGEMKQEQMDMLINQKAV